MQRCREGSRESKRELLQRIMPTLRAATRSLLGAGADADDACQQAAIDVLRGLGSYRGEAPLGAWARTVAVRAGLRHIRRHQRQLALVDPEATQRAQEGVQPRSSADERLPRPLSAYLDALPAAQREALVLRHALGYTVPEIAELLETSVNTIKSRLSTARKDIRKRIRQDEATASIRREGGSS